MRWIGPVIFLVSLPLNVQADRSVAWSLNTGVAIPVSGSIDAVATVGPSLSGEALYSMLDWCSLGISLSLNIPVPKTVRGLEPSVPYFLAIFARGLFHGGDAFKYWASLGVGLSYYGLPECTDFCTDGEAVARFGGDVSAGIGGRVSETLTIGPSASFVVPDFIRGTDIWFLTANVTMQWGL